MMSTELLVTVALFVVQMVIAVYLIRYSNQQLMKSISGLRDKNLELMKLNARLTKTVIMNEDGFRKELDGLRKSKSSDKTVVQAVTAKE
ncbi:MAG: hypothetical protein FJY86_00860 [Candidatus Diapherotrites archaeon]|uniref:Uncharacterized protein n=1 Tax=Candidatus Iainarchaeum sp. TaxID=3101447 RepID=A0A8T4C5U1_9ARCH|nr:hypothetical protein [Candidatus Diapherotrites archaeon]